MYPGDHIQAVFFDLDGTLLDTADDIANATNRVLVHHGLAPRPLTEIRPFIGGGITSILTNLFTHPPKQISTALLRQQILQSYQQSMLQHTQLFNGMIDVLTLLQTQQVPWGIITSKPAWLAEPLIAAIKELMSAAILVGRETLPVAKPHPLPLTYAARHLPQIAHQHCVYIGDAKTDIQAAQAAGMQSIAAAYGYILPQDHPKNWGADYIIDTPYDLIPWLKSRVAIRT